MPKISKWFRLALGGTCKTRRKTYTDLLLMTSLAKPMLPPIATVVIPPAVAILPSEVIAKRNGNSAKSSRSIELARVSERGKGNTTLTALKKRWKNHTGQHGNTIQQDIEPLIIGLWRYRRKRVLEICSARVYGIRKGLAQYIVELVEHLFDLAGPGLDREGVGLIRADCKERIVPTS
jgi:hypothetical protein